MKKKITAIVLVIVMLAMLFTGMTLAYFTDTDSAVNVFTVGDVDIELDETVGVTDSNGNPAPDRVVDAETGAIFTGIMPGNYMQKTVTVTNNENPAYVRVTVIVNNYKQINAIGEYFEKKWDAMTNEERETTGKSTRDEYVQAVYDDIFDGWKIDYTHYNDDMRMTIHEVTAVDDDLMKVDSTFTTNQGSFYFSLFNWFKTEHEVTRANTGNYDAGQNVGVAGGYYAQYLNNYELCYTYYLDMDKGDTATLFDGLSCPTYFDQELAAMFNGLNIEIYAAAIQKEGFATPEKAFKLLNDEYSISDMRASVTTETLVENNTELDEAIKAGETDIILTEAGVYIIPDSAKGKTLTITGTEGTVIATQDDGSYEGCDYSLDGSTVTFNNITINTDSSTYTGYARLNATYNNCTINGTYTLYGNSEFNNCTFNVSGNVYNIWTWGAPNATFNNCIFNSDGKALLLYGQVNTKLTIDNCVFNDNGGLTDKKAAIEIGNDYNKSYELIVNNTTVNGYEVNDKGINTGTTLWANKNSMDKDHLNVVVDGVDVY